MNNQSFPMPDKKDILLVVIDVQERPMAVMPPEIGDNILKNISVLISSADILQFPIIYTEHYPRGLGKTSPQIKQILLNHSTPIEKISLSCCGEDTFNNQLVKINKKQVILTGIEAHVCVLQTALDLLRQDFIVFIVSDAICSRHKLDWQIALSLANKAGAFITTTEIILFQLLGRAGTADFKNIQNLLK